MQHPDETLINIRLEKRDETFGKMKHLQHLDETSETLEI
jgi:hypothetical protein